MKRLTPNANEFIKCMIINDNIVRNCSEFFDIRQSIFGNKEFGICYKFIKYDINYKSFESIKFIFDHKMIVKIFKLNLIFNNLVKKDETVFLANLQLRVDSTKYFKTYIYTDDNRIPKDIIDRAVMIDELGVRGEVIISTKTTVEWLSQPFMTECKNYGKF